MKKNTFLISNGAAASSLVLALLSPLAGAAGLSEITVFSALGQPLRAEIRVDATAKEIPGMEARLASPEVFASNGMNYAVSMRQLRFTVERRGKGAVIKVTSDGPINDPIMSFMLDLNWPDGRLTKGYTFLLDPIDIGRGASVSTRPDDSARYSRSQASVTQSVQVDDRQPGVQQESRRGKRSVSTPSAKPDSKAESSSEDGGVGHTVRRGETLHSIARNNLSSGVTLEQMVVALHRNNIVAFENGDANRLLSGAVLRIPSVAEANQLSPAEAREIYRSTFPAQKPVATQARSEGMARAPTAKAPARTAEDLALEREMKAREREIKEQEKRAAELERKAEQLRKKLAAQEAAEAKARAEAEKQAALKADKEAKAKADADARAAAKAEADAKAKADADARAAAKAEADARAKADADARAAAKAEADARAKADADARAAAEADARAKADADAKAAAAAAEAAIKEEEERLKAEAERLQKMLDAQKEPEPPIADTTDRTVVEPPVVEPPPVVVEPQRVEPPPITPPQTTPTPRPAPALDTSEPEDDSSMITLLGGGAALLALLGGGWYFMRRRKATSEEEGSEAYAPSTGKLVSGLSGFSDDGLNSIFQVTTGQSVNTSNAATPPSELSQALPDSFGADEVDPVVEADVYMSYARDAQAEELLLDALPKDPNRIAIRLKLLEIYANRKSLREFEVIAREVQAQTGGRGSDWDKVVMMGAALDPNNPLYGGGRIGGAPSVVEEMSHEENAAIAFSMRTDPGMVTPEPADPGMVAFGRTEPEPIALDIGESEPIALDIGESEPIALELEQSEPDALALASVSDDPLLKMLREDKGGLKPTDSDLDFDLEAIEKDEKSLALMDSEPETVVMYESATLQPSGTGSELDFSFDEEEPVLEAEPVAMKPSFAPEPQPLYTPEQALEEDSIDTWVTGVDQDAAATVVNPDFAFTKTLTQSEETEGINVPGLDLDLDLASQLMPEDMEMELAATTFMARDGEGQEEDVEFDVQLTESTVLGNTGSLDDLSSIDLDLQGEPSAEEARQEITEPGGLALEAEPSGEDVPSEMTESILEAIDDAEALAYAESPEGRREEINTKLDLASVYEEMGDLEGARELLVEVVNEGSPDQVAQAEAILARL